MAHVCAVCKTRRADDNPAIHGIGESLLSLTDLIWLATAAYGVHILEEYQLNWRDWARGALALPVDWTDFYVVNALVIVLGAVAANIAHAAPAIALGFPALMLINATFFHVLPVIRGRGRFSPGVITGVLLFYPVAIACYAKAWPLSAGAIALSFAVGALLMAAPVVLILVKDRPYFQQK
jgi:hypothetical protein